MSSTLQESGLGNHDQADPHSRVFDRHRGPVTCVAGIPGQAAAVSSGYDSALALVDLDSGAIDLLGYHQHLINRVVVNTAGTLAASCSSDYTVCIWNLEKRQLLRTLNGHWDDVEDFAFIDDDTGVSVSRDRRIFVWNLHTGAITKVLEGHERDVLSVVHANGKIYTSGDDMTLRQWDINSGELLQTWGPFTVETDTCAIDPKLNRAILGADDGSIRIFNCDSGANIGQIDAHSSGIKKVAVSPINGDILSAAYDQRILIWDAHTLELKQELKGHSATWERSLNWSPDGNSVLAGTFDGTVLQWETQSGRLSVEIPAESKPEGNACFNDVSCNESGLCAIVSDDGYLRLAKLAAHSVNWTDQAKSTSGRILMNAVHISAADSSHADGPVVWTGAHDQKLHVYAAKGSQLHSEAGLHLNEGPINCIRTLPVEGDYCEAMVACYSGAVVRVRRKTNGELQLIKRLNIHEGAVKAVRVHPNGKTAISGAADGTLFSWDLSGRILHKFAGHTAIVDDVDYDPSGQWLASVSRDFTVNVYESGSGRMLHSILLGRQSPKCVLFWDANTVIVGNYWGTLWRVELNSGAISSHQIACNGVSSLARWGQHVVAVSYDGSVCVLDVNDMEISGHSQFMLQKVN